MDNVTEYRLITSLSNMYWRGLGMIKNSPTPSPGQIVNIDGNPFIVYEIGHALNTTNESGTYSYVNVFKAGDFKLKSESSEI